MLTKRRSPTVDAALLGTGALVAVVRVIGSPSADLRVRTTAAWCSTAIAATHARAARSLLTAGLVPVLLNAVATEVLPPLPQSANGDTAAGQPISAAAATFGTQCLWALTRMASAGASPGPPDVGLQLGAATATALGGAEQAGDGSEPPAASAAPAAPVDVRAEVVAAGALGLVAGVLERHAAPGPVSHSSGTGRHGQPVLQQPPSLQGLALAAAWTAVELTAAAAPAVAPAASAASAAAAVAAAGLPSGASLLLPPSPVPVLLLPRFVGRADVVEGALRLARATAALLQRVTRHPVDVAHAEAAAEAAAAAAAAAAPATAAAAPAEPTAAAPVAAATAGAGAAADGAAQPAARPAGKRGGVAASAGGGAGGGVSAVILAECACTTAAALMLVAATASAPLAASSSPSTTSVALGSPPAPAGLAAALRAALLPDRASIDALVALAAGRLFRDPETKAAPGGTATASAAATAAVSAALASADERMFLVSEATRIAAVLALGNAAVGAGGGDGLLAARLVEARVVPSLLQAALSVHGGGGSGSEGGLLVATATLDSTQEGGAGALAAAAAAAASAGGGGGGGLGSGGPRRLPLLRPVLWALSNLAAAGAGPAAHVSADPWLRQVRSMMGRESLQTRGCGRCVR